MDVVHTWPYVRYWSEDLSCTIPTNMRSMSQTLKKKNIVSFWLKSLEGCIF